MPPRLALVFPLLLAGCSREAVKVEPQATAGTCRECHAAVVQSYARTGMGRSFRAVSGGDHSDTTAPWLHQPSQTWFQLVRRDGALFHRRWQVGAGGQEENVEELRADYVMGSGNRVRTYLHRTRRDTLIELPLAIFADAGAGTPALNPGFDTAAPPTRRRIGYDCMYCHNATLTVAAGHEEAFAEPVFPAALPGGIDCARCHGPAEEHVRAARQAKPSPAELRRTIVNPARLPAERSLEVCLQCHLETTSSALPNVIRKFDRGPFSYRPGQPLAEFAQYFDHAAGTGHEDKFEIVSSAYRLRQSACFVKSGGALTCIRCHNPHVPAVDAGQRTHYNDVCGSCHAGKLAARHPVGPDCTGCHMPPRRAEDVVRSVMTDHRIGRPSGRNLTAALAEKHGAAAVYQGRVAAYYPAQADPLYQAAAQLIAKSNVRQGVAELQRLLAGGGARWEFHVVLADVLPPAEALPHYRAALAQRPRSAMLMRRLAAVFQRMGQADEALKWLRQAVESDGHDGAAWYDLGVLERARQQWPAALAALRRAAQEDPDSVEIATTLGAALAESGDRAGAEVALRTARRIDPFDASAAANLAVLLAAQERRMEALEQFEQALRYNPADGKTRFNYGVVLAQLGRLAEAEREVRSALRSEPGLAEAHHVLGGLLLQRDDVRGAMGAYREALRLRPAFAKARLDLGLSLLAQGQAEGLEHVKRAASEGDAEVRAEADRVLAGLGK